MKFRLKYTGELSNPPVGIKVDAIKSIRGQLGTGLKESKELVDAAIESGEGFFEAEKRVQYPQCPLPGMFNLVELSIEGSILNDHKQVIINAIKLDRFDLAQDLIKLHQDLRSKYEECEDPIWEMARIS